MEFPTSDGYRGLWFTLGQFSEFGDKYSGGLGTYTANHTPLAVYSPAAQKTFFTYGGTVAGKNHLLIMVSYFDHRTGLVPRPVVVHDKEGVDDPHDNASLNIDRAGHIWVFVSGRAKERPGFIYRSRFPGQIHDFERIYEGELTYPQPWSLPDGGWFHLFTRYTAGRELYFQHVGAGQDWQSAQKLAGFAGHYQVSSQAKDGRIGTFWNYHPHGDVNRRTNIYYAQTADLGCHWTNASGEKLDVPLNSPENPALVENLKQQGLLQYTCDLNFDAQNRPLLLYVTSRDALPGPQGNPRELRLTRWNGEEWVSSRVCEAGHNYDMGSLWVEGEKWTVVAPLLERPQAWQGGGEIGIWTSRNQGQNWSLERQITRNSQFNHNYVRRPLNAQDSFFAFWADGDPTQQSESRLYFCDSSGQVWQLPSQIEGEMGIPIEVKP